MNLTETEDDAGLGSDAQLAAYQLLIETMVEDSTDEVFLQRALAVVLAVPWPSPHTFFSAFLPSLDGSSLRQAAIAAGSAAPPPPCADMDASSCLCGRALTHPERLRCIDAAEAARPLCDSSGTGTHLILPLLARGRVLGVLHALVDSAQCPGGSEQSFLVQVASLLGAGLHRRRSESEHDRLEMQFLQAQKMEAVGRLAGGVAHDFNNILTAITNYADLGLLKLPAESPLRRHFEEIIAASDRAALLTQQLLAFSRRQVLVPRVIDLNTAIPDLVKTVRRLLGADIEFSINAGRGPARIKADPALFEQLIINLAVSLRDAMPQGGAITIATATTELDAAYTLSHPMVAPGSYVCLAISASGPGMDAHHLDALGGPSNSPREPHASATLGLAAVKDIVLQGGGHAQIEASPDSGTRVRICFPAASAETAGAPGAGGTFDLPRGDETILLAEDDDSVRVVMGEVLRDLGYRVLEAREGREALAIAAKHTGRIDLLLTDVVMPGFRGSELQERLATTRPGLRVLYISGVMDDAIAHHGPAVPGAVFLHKPFSPWSLASRLRQVLDTPPPH